MISIRLFILNSKGKLLLQKTKDGLQIPQMDCTFIEGCTSLEDMAFLKLSSFFGITDIHPKDLRLYSFSNKIQDDELFLDMSFVGHTRSRRVELTDYKFMELREIKKVVDLFKDKADERMIRRFIIREEDPTICQG